MIVSINIYRRSRIIAGAINKLVSIIISLVAVIQKKSLSQMQSTPPMHHITVEAALFSENICPKTRDSSISNSSLALLMVRNTWSRIIIVVRLVMKFKRSSPRIIAHLNHKNAQKTTLH